MKLFAFVSWRLAENSRLRRQVHPRRYVNVSGVTAHISFGGSE